MSSLKPVSFDDYGNKYWRRPEDFMFAKADSFAPLVAQELQQALFRVPVGFIEVDNQYRLVAIQGIEQSSNLLVASDGRWIGKYRPEIYNYFPFCTVRTGKENESQFALCVDEGSNLVVNNEAEVSEGTSLEKFYEMEGKLSESLSSIRDALQKYTNSMMMTQTVCQLLSALGLLIPWEINWRNQDDEFSTLEGFYCVDQDALARLESESLVKLRDTGALMVVYGHLFSRQHIGGLIQISQTPQESGGSKELNLELMEDFGTISFDNF